MCGGYVQRAAARVKTDLDGQLLCLPEAISCQASSGVQTQQSHRAERRGVCLYVCVCARAHTCVDMCLHVCVYEHVSACVCAHVYVFVCAHVCV